MARQRTPGRRRYQWLREISDVVQVPDSGTTVINLFSITDVEILAEGLAAPTLVRTRGEYIISIASATSTPGLVQRVGVGILVVPSTVAGTAIGGPIAAANQEWLYWSAHALITPSAGAEDVAPGFVRVPYDVKAMRKIHKSSVRFMVENAGDSVAEINIAWSASCLFQE